MPPIERVAYNAAIDAARITAITIETAEDAHTFRERITAEALAAFAEGAKELMLETAVSCSIPDVNRTANLL